MVSTNTAGGLIKRPERTKAQAPHQSSLTDTAVCGWDTWFLLGQGGSVGFLLGLCWWEKEHSFICGVQLE